MIQATIFYFLAAMILIPALLVVGLKNVFHSALWLVMSLFGVAGIYAMLAADFLFAVQIIVYAGGIMVILLFVVLLSGRPSDWAQRQVNEKAWAAGLFSLFFVAVLGTTLSNWSLIPKLEEPKLSTGQLGTLLLTDMVVPFEVVGIVLVAALIGAIYFSNRKSS